MHSPLILGVRTHEQAERLAHHQLVNTYELEGNLRSQVRLEGVFCFGGENEEGTVNNALSFINVLGKGGQNLDIKFKRWESVSTNDDRPCPRKEHTLTLIAKKAVAVLAGGIDQLGRWLDDVWLLDLVRLSWTKVSTSPSIGESIGYACPYLDFWQVTVPARLALSCTFTTDRWKRNGKRLYGCWRPKVPATRPRRRYLIRSCPPSRVCYQTRSFSPSRDSDVLMIDMMSASMNQ